MSHLSAKEPRLVAAVLAALLVLTTPSAANAMTFRQSDRGETVVIPAGETIDDDLYIAGGDIEVRGTVRGSLFAAGDSVSVEGSVTGDVWAAGNRVVVAGDVGRSVHAAGSEVSIDGNAGGDLMAAGNTVDVSSRAVGERDAALAGSRVSLDGRIARNLFIGASRALIAGEVGGDVNAGVERLTLQDGASVRGDVKYTSEREATIASGAEVGGRVTRREPAPWQKRTPGERLALAFVFWLRRFIGLLLFGLIVTLAFPRFTRHASDAIGARPLPALGLGFAALIGVPIVAGFAFFLGLLVGGWWIGLFAFALYAIAIAVATVVSAVFLGRRLLGAGRRPEPHLVGALALGLLLLTVAEAIPFLGALVRFAEVVFGLGAIVLAIAWRAPGAAVPAEQPAVQPPVAPL